MTDPKRCNNPDKENCPGTITLCEYDILDKNTPRNKYMVRGSIPCPVCGHQNQRVIAVKGKTETK